jgi:D-glycero-alpha-D-manno-heptose-7-phosphate kinase
MLIVRTPVRVSFGGGGTDLPAYYSEFGGAVLSTTINKYFYTILCKRSDDKVQVISSDLRALETWHDLSRIQVHGNDLEIPLAVLKSLHFSFPIDLFLASEIRPGTGLGSSAAVCVNVLKILSEYAGAPLSKYALAERAFDIARNVLGKPIGKQDEYAAAFGGLNFIRFEPDESVVVEPVELAPNLLRELENNLMLFFTGAAHQSWHILQEQEHNTRAHSSSVTALHEIRELAERMRTSLQDERLEQFAVLLDEGWKAKKRVSEKITSRRIDKLYNLAKENGAIGGKITGAGGGGFLLLYCEAGHQAAVRQAFSAEDVREMRFRFDAKGPQVIANDPFVDDDDRCGSDWVFTPLNANAAARRAERS